MKKMLSFFQNEHEILISYQLSIYTVVTVALTVLTVEASSLRIVKLSL